MSRATSLHAAPGRSPLGLCVALTALLIGLTGCSGEGPSGVADGETCESIHGVSDAITGLTTTTASGTLSATIDGEPWSAREDICVSYGITPGGQETLFVIGYDGDRVPGPGFLGSESLSMVFDGRDGPLGTGTYTLGDQSVGARSVGFTWLTALGPLQALQWTAQGAGDFHGGATGTATITTFSANRVAGTFAFIGLPGGGHDLPNVVVTDGSFDLRY